MFGIMEVGFHCLNDDYYPAERCSESSRHYTRRHHLRERDQSAEYKLHESHEVLAIHCEFGREVVEVNLFIHLCQGWIILQHLPSIRQLDVTGWEQSQRAAKGYKSMRRALRLLSAL